MMGKHVLSIYLMIIGSVALSAQENIAAARAMGLGSTVTVSGIVTNGDELGLIRYMQDSTGGIAVYSAMMGSVNRGDSVTVTGVLKEYQTLLEIDPVNQVTVHTTGHGLPEPVELTPAQFEERYEGMLVRINNAELNASGTFERKSYAFTANGEDGQIYINASDSPLIGTVIPTGEITLVGPLGAYNNNYQVLPRDSNDLLASGIINMTAVPVMSNLSTTGFSVSWTTDTDGTTEAFYGNTSDLELGTLSVPGVSNSHSVDLSGLESSELIYLQPYSVNGTDTAKAAIQVYITTSASSGDMKTYFNRSVDSSVSLGMLEAQLLDRALDDTLIAYINRAEVSIDFTVYNLNNSGISDISGALNAAHDRGVRVRVVYDGDNDAAGVKSLNPEIGKIASPVSDYPYGIMHNKFVVFDAGSADPDKPVVWTGATNYTYGQINTDPNNVIVIQDKSLATAFQLEFEEMYGSDGTKPDNTKARFGPYKADNTPHEFNINGKRVECYFSPSDGTHTRILNTIETADHSLHIATMLITMSDIGDNLALKNDEGVDVKVLINDYDQYGEPIVNTLKESLQEDVRLPGESGIMHHKYMIVDQANDGSDPILLTGSHNWSSSARLRNDENTLIIHDQGVANAYYQEFVERFSHGQLIISLPVCYDDVVTMESGTSIRYDVLRNDDLSERATLSIYMDPKHGSAQVDTDNTLTYFPDSTFNQDTDTIGYIACLVSNPGLCDSALFIIHVNKPTGIEHSDYGNYCVKVYPNPAGDRFIISSETDDFLSMFELVDQSGRIILKEPLAGLHYAEINSSAVRPGIYFIRITMSGGDIIMKKIAFR